MASSRARSIVLVAVLAVAVLVLAVVAVVVLPIVTHRSAGGSGQAIPEGYPAETSAVGADGRTRALNVVDAQGEPIEMDALEPGERITVRGTGFDAGIGIYVAICAIPGPGEKPSPCLGGVPEGATTGEADTSELTSAWVTDAWAWRAFATHSYGDDGSFEVELVVPEAAQEGLDCTVADCALATRADHTASDDRVQDLLLPVAFADS